MRAPVIALLAAGVASCGGDAERLLLALPYHFGQRTVVSTFFADCWRLSRGMTLAEARALMAAYDQTCTGLSCGQIADLDESDEERSMRITFASRESSADWCIVYARRGTIERIAVSPD